MAKYRTLMVSGPHGFPTGVAWNTSWYATPGQGGFGTTNVGDALPAEARRRHYIYTDGLVTALAARRNGSTSGVSDTVILRVNAADSALQITSTDNGAVTEDTDSVSVSSGNYLTFRHTNSDPCYIWVRMLFEPTADNTQVTRYCAASRATVFSVGTGAAIYFAWTGRLNANATESESQVSVKIAGTFRNVRIWVFRNRSTAAVTIRSRKNGANGNISITVPAGSGSGYTVNVGVFADLTNTDSVAVDDNYCFTASAATGNSIDFTVVDVDFVPTVVNGDHELFLADDAGQTISASAVAQYFAPGGGLDQPKANDSDVNATFGMACGARMFRMKIRSNTCGAQVFTVMKNNAATALTFTVDASGTGEFVDSVNSITLTASDTVSIRMEGGGAGSMVVQYFAMIIPGATGSGETPSEDDEDEVAEDEETQTYVVRQFIPYERQPFAEYDVGDERTTFPVKFRLMAQADLRVTVDHEELTQSAFTFTGIEDEYQPGYRGGRLVLDDEVEDAIVRIWGEPAPARTSDFTTGQLNARRLNEALETLWAHHRAQHQRMNRLPCRAPGASEQLSVTASGQLFIVV